MTKSTCEICGGTGVALSPRLYNRVVHFGDGEYKEEPCWSCGGTGEVMVEVSNHNMHIHKYWMVGDEHASEDTQTG